MTQIKNWPKLKIDTNLKMTQIKNDPNLKMTQIQAARGFPLSERGGWSEDEEGERGKTKKRERGWKDQSKWQQNGDGGGELPEGKPEPCSHLNAGELSAQKGSFKFLHRKVVISTLVRTSHLKMRFHFV